MLHCSGGCGVYQAQAQAQPQAQAQAQPQAQAQAQAVPRPMHGQSVQETHALTVWCR